MEVTLPQLLMALGSAFLVGFSKAGMPGLGVLLVPLMAAAVGENVSTGVLLPVLICGDIIAVARYRAHIEWRIVLRLLPWVLPGIVLGGTVLKHFTENREAGNMGLILGIMVLCLVAFQIIRERAGGWMEEKLPRKWWFSVAMGLLAGFATGLAHLAGPVMIVYFLSMDLKKHSFMGSAAMFFMIVNLSKIPLYIPQGTLVYAQFAFSLKVILAVPAGALVGLLLFPYIRQGIFNRIVLVLAAAAAIKLLWPYLAG